MAEQKQVAVFGGGDWDEGGINWDLGLDVGDLLAELGFQVVTGGYGGAMAAACKGAVESGGSTLAFLHQPIEERKPNPWVQEQVQCRDYLERMANLLRIPISIALPGRSGTLAEIAVAHAMMKRHRGRILAVYSPFWKKRARDILGEMRPGMDSNLFWFHDMMQLRMRLEMVD